MHYNRLLLKEVTTSLHLSNFNLNEENMLKAL